MRSSNDIFKNIKTTKRLINIAINQKTDFILTPEVSSFFSLNIKELLHQITYMKDDLYLKAIMKLAKKYKKWILVGSIVTRISKKN
tara:strand:+ start:96 stop:353 length:258 start_codon:yes stop_codon:yes gene_type:complete